MLDGNVNNQKDLKAIIHTEWQQGHLAEGW